MTKVLSALICLFFFSIGSYSQSQNKAVKTDDATVKELTKIVSEIYDAGTSGDKKVIEKYFAETYLETDAFGILRDKAWNLSATLPAQKLIYKINDAQIRKYDKVVILYYRWVVTINKRNDATAAIGKDEIIAVIVQLQVTDTFIKTNNGWRIISSSRIELRDKREQIKSPVVN